MPTGTWNKSRIVDELKRLQRQGKDLSYNAMARKQQSLLSAAAYHFGSYRAAALKAGIDYTQVTRRPRWTKEGIVKLLKRADRQSIMLNWSAVTGRGDELSKAAFAALQPRLFGTWEKALRAAGLERLKVSRYRRWNEKAVTTGLCALARANKALNSGAVQQSDPGLHAAAVRLFTRYDAALVAAKLDPKALRRRHQWNKAQVIAQLSELTGPVVKSTRLRERHPALYGACVRLFGSMTAARRAARLPIGIGGSGKVGNDQRSKAR